VRAGRNDRRRPTRAPDGSTKITPDVTSRCRPPQQDRPPPRERHEPSCEDKQVVAWMIAGAPPSRRALPRLVRHFVRRRL
jgi:hypothetical protein